MYAYSAIALFAGLAAAVHAPVGDPSGNAITAPLNEIVPACKPFTIKWTPTTPNKISILLLRGPSTNVVPIGAPIVESIANSGSFVWTPSSDLEADTTHYGIQLIDDVTGQYQYSTQFGISKDSSCSAATSKASSAASASSSAAVTSAPSSAKTSVVVAASTNCSTTSTKYVTKYPSSSSVKASTQVAVISTGSPFANTSVVQPTGSLTVPVSLLTSATPTGAGNGGSTASPSAPQRTGAAARVGAGLGMVGAVAGLVAML